jgi:chemotaxis protein MotD
MLATADAARPTPRPAEKAPNKTDAGTQAVLAKADVVVIDEAPAAPAPAGKDPPRPKGEAPPQASAEPSAAETRATPQEQRPDPQAAPPSEPQASAPASAPATTAAPNVATHVEMPQTREIATALAQPVPSPKLQPAPAPNIAALASAIAARSGQGAKTFEIRLDPADLGRVEVHLHVSRDGKAEATLYAERPETVVLLQRDSHNLERALKDAGLDVSNSSLNFSLKGEQRQGDGGGASGGHTRSLPDAVVARSEAVNASLASQIIPSDDGRLDIRV